MGKENRPVFPKWEKKTVPISRIYIATVEVEWYNFVKFVIQEKHMELDVKQKELKAKFIELFISSIREGMDKLIDFL